MKLARWIVLLLVSLVATAANAQSSALSNAAKLRVIVVVTDPQFAGGAKCDGSTDDTAALSAVRTYVAGLAQPVMLEFPAGQCNYSTSPNWAIRDLWLVAKGKTILKHTGSGNAVIFDAGAVTGLVSGPSMQGFTVQGNAATTNGVFQRGIQHATLRNILIRDVSGAGIYTQFVVVNTYDTVRVSAEGVAFTTTPVNGVVLDRRGVTDEESHSGVFTNFIVEGVSGSGIKGVYAVGNSFTGGTSEGNARGIELSANSFRNHFQSIDLEANTVEDVLNGGYDNTFEDVDCLSTGAQGTLHFSNGAVRNKVMGGTYNNVTLDAGANINRIWAASYNLRGTGAFTDNGTGNIKVGNSDMTAGTVAVSSLPGAAFTKRMSVTRADATYGASVAIDADNNNAFTLTVTNGVAFTIANPTGGADGQQIWITIRNASGGVMATPTWDTAYQVTFTKPANNFSRSVIFEKAGAFWRMIGGTPADVSF